MPATFLTWILAAAFAGAGLFNAIGTEATQASFVRWGYPAWWCRITGALEIVIAGLIAVPATHAIGLLVGAVVIAAAIATVARHGNPFNSEKVSRNGTPISRKIPVRSPKDVMIPERET